MLGEAGPSLLRHWIERAATRDPDKAFIVSADDGRTLTYGQLRALTGRIATHLRDQGVGTNDRIALLSNNSIEHLATYFGVLAYGATICTVHVEMNRNQLDSILPMLKPRMVLCEDGLGLDDIIKAVSAPCRPLGAWDDRRGDSFFAAVNACEPGDASADAGADDSAVILFTSGTSARPKGVVLSFRELLSNAEPTADGFNLTAQDRIYDFRSFNWCSAQTLSAVPPLCRGATLILGRKFSRSRFFDHIRQYGATIATGNPTTIGILLNGDAASAPELPTLRFMTSSSAPLLVDEWRRFEERFGIRVAQGYGCSEIGWIAAQPGEQRRIGTVGRPHDYHRLSIVGAEGQMLPPGEPGAVELGGLRGNAYRTLADDGSIRVDCRGPDEDRRPRLSRRRGLSASDRPRQGPDHPRRRQHLAAGDRRRPDAAVRGDRGLHRRRAGQDVRRGGGRLCRAAARRRRSAPTTSCAIAPPRCRRSRRRSRSC